MSDAVTRLNAALEGHYAIERELGEGGMATVYLADDIKHERKVALKVLKSELAAVVGAERFLAEIKTTANLQHPHILPLFDSGDADGFLFYVMPHVEGESLRERLDREKQLAVDEALRITTAVANALDYAHRHDVIHRDIKPENILLHDGRPMVADFGIALAVSAAAGGRMTETGLSIGTPHYMSPEQATAERDLTHRSDVYSLGAVLYELLAGEPPHTGTTAQAIVMKIVTDEPRPVNDHRKSVPLHVTAATMKALEKLAADRFENAARFAEALSDPTFRSVRYAGAGASRSSGLGPSNRWTIGFAGSTALLLAALVWFGTRPISDPQVLRYRMDLPEGEALRSSADPGSHIAISPDGRTLVYVGTGPAGGTQLWMRPRDALTARPLPGTEGASHPFFSADGRRVAFFTTGVLPAIRAVAVVGGPPVTLVESGVAYRGGSWGSDGTIYAAGTGPELVRIPTGQDTVEVIEGLQEEVALGWPHSLPNGRGLIYSSLVGGTSAVRDYTVGVIDLATSTAVPIVDAVRGWYTASGHLLYVTADGTLMATRFDQNRMVTVGTAVPMATDVAVRNRGVVDLAVSETGTLVYRTGVVAIGAWEPVWVDREGTATPVDSGWQLEVGEPELALSPDGRRLAIRRSTEAGDDIWIKELDRGPLRRLTTAPEIDRRPRWTSDGSAVLFVSNRTGSYAVYRREANGITDAEPVFSYEGGVLEVVPTPREDVLVVRVGGLAGTANLRDLLVLGPGSDMLPSVLADDPQDEMSPAVSRDGRWVAYVSNETGRYEVYVRPFPDAAGGKWTVSIDGGRTPIWGPQGELYYVNSREEFVHVTTQESDAGFNVTEREVLFSFTSLGLATDEFVPLHDISPDGRRFVALRAVGAAGDDVQQLVVVENFFEELKAKVGN